MLPEPLFVKSPPTVELAFMETMAVEVLTKSPTISNVPFAVVLAELLFVKDASHSSPESVRAEVPLSVTARLPAPAQPLKLC